MPDTVAGYSTVEKLASLLNVDASAREEDLTRVLEAAKAEIDAELGLSVPYDETNPAPDIAVEVNLERAVEHWQQGRSPFGLIGLGETGPAFASTDTWNRHAAKLAPLKQSWGIG